MSFRPTNIRVDKGFISNVRHFTEQSNLSNVIVTSDIRAEDAPKLNCVSYLNNSDGGQRINWCPFFDTLEAYSSPFFVTSGVYLSSSTPGCQTIFSTIL